MSTGITDVEWLDAKVCELSEINAELLEALEKLIEEVEERGYRKPSVRALIRKAKGEA